MYLSRLTLNPRHADARRDLASPYEMHRTLMRGTDDAEGRLLFRIEPLENGTADPVVLVQALAKPDWSRLPSGYLLRVQGPRSFIPQLEEGQQLHFRLSANPTKKVDGSRIPLTYATPPDDPPPGFKTYWDWLHRRAGMAGFEVIRAQDALFRTASNRTGRSDYTKHQIPHFGVRFDGLLRVADPQELIEAVRRGIGPAKAFGFGLLSLARPT